MKKDEEFSLSLPQKMCLSVLYLGALIGLCGLISLIRWIFGGAPNSNFYIFSSLFTGAWIGLFVSSLQTDWIEPLWERRIRRNVELSHLVELPDHALDRVLAYEPGRARLRFSRECRAWLKTNMKKRHGLYPIRPIEFHKREKIPRMWFRDANDAIAFKVRWL